MENIKSLYLSLDVFGRLFSRLRFSFLLVLLLLCSANTWGEVTPLKLPYSWPIDSGKSAYTEALGCTLSGLGDDYGSAPKLKFDNTGDYMIIQVADAPDAISFRIKGVSISGTYSFKVQESSDGSSYTDAKDITSLSSSISYISQKLKSSTRYIKLVYATKATGNVAVDGIAITQSTPSHKVFFSANGTTLNPGGTELKEGAAITFPSTNPEDVNHKTFMGWYGSSYSDPTTPPVYVTSATMGTQDVTYYAVYASKNGGKIGDIDSTTYDFTSYIPSSSYTNTEPRVYGIWSVTNGTVSDLKAVTDKMGKQALLLQYNNNGTPSAMVAAVDGFYGISAYVATTDNSVSYSIQYSYDQGASWTSLVDQCVHSGVRAKLLQSPAKLSNPIPSALVRIIIHSATSTGATYRVYVDDIKIYSTSQSFYYFDYTTTCPVVENITATWNTDGGVMVGEAPTATLGTSLTMPAATKECHRLTGWKSSLNDDDVYAAGEKFLTNHDVTFTAQWEYDPENCHKSYTVDKTAIYTTSATGVTMSASMTGTVTVIGSDQQPVAILSGADAAMFRIRVVDTPTGNAGDGYVWGYTVQYTPTGDASSHAAQVVFREKAETTEGCSPSEPVVLTGRVLPNRFVIAACRESRWYALPADIGAASNPVGYPISVDNTTTPTQATMVPANSLYTMYGLKTYQPNSTDSSFVRFAATKTDKALWASASETKIRNWTDIKSATVANYKWRLSTEDNIVYHLQDSASDSNRWLKIWTDNAWGRYVNGNADLYLLPVAAVAAEVTMNVMEWGTNTVRFQTNVAIPAYSTITVYADEAYAATMTGENMSYTLSVTGLDFAQYAGTTLSVLWADAQGTVVASGSLTKPTVITGNTDLSSVSGELETMDFYVGNGAKLTSSSNISVHKIQVNAGGTLAVNGGTLTVNELQMAGGLNSNGYDVPRIYIAPEGTLSKTTDRVHLDLAVDSRHYYPFAVPFAVSVSDIDYVDEGLTPYSTYGTHYVIKTYDGARRAQDGEGSANWRVVEASETLQPGVGYILTAVTVNGYDSRIRIPMQVANGWTANGEQGVLDEVHRDQSAVTAHTGTKATEHLRHAGWNFVANPYLAGFAGNKVTADEALDYIKGQVVINDGQYEYENTEVVYVSVPTYDFSEYIQTPLAEAVLRPEWPFFIQTDTSGTMNFLTEGRQPIPARYRAATEAAPVRKNKVNLLLTSDSLGTADHTGLVISDRYTASYELGADLEKMFGDGYTLATYTLMNGTRLVYNALSESDAQQTIPLGFRAPHSGTYTFSMVDDDELAGLEGLDLIDYSTGVTTDLLQQSYSFTTSKVQEDGRFAIHARMQQQTPTSLEEIQAAEGVQKVVRGGVLYILRDGKWYDARGVQVK